MRSDEGKLEKDFLFQFQGTGELCALQNRKTKSLVNGTLPLMMTSFLLDKQRCITQFFWSSKMFSSQTNDVDIKVYVCLTFLSAALQQGFQPYLHSAGISSFLHNNFLCILTNAADGRQNRITGMGGGGRRRRKTGVMELHIPDIKCTFISSKATNM